MRNIKWAMLVLVLAYVMTFNYGGCGGGGGKSSSSSSVDTYDVDVNGIPRFVNVDYIELGKINSLSKFRSGAGHDYSDDFEFERSMKHYFGAITPGDPTIKIFSPITGTILSVGTGTSDVSVNIKSTAYPAFYFVIFHVKLTNPLNVGDMITEGQQLGTSATTISDIAVIVQTPNDGPKTGWGRYPLDGGKCISYFEVITDSVFQNYQARGITTRDMMTISKAYRDANPVSAWSQSNLDNPDDWIVLP